jgi:predicted nuclease with TOPRIM domain
MYNYEKKIKELGLNKSALPKSLATPISELNEAAKELQDLRNDLANLEEDDDSAEDINSQIAEYQNIIAEADDELVAKVQTYVDKKPYYDAKYQHMKQADDAKKAAKVQWTSPMAQSGTISVQSGNVSTSTNTVTPNQGVVASQGMVVEKKEEKKDDLGTWLFWGLVGTAGILVGVNLFKNKK